MGSTGVNNGTLIKLYDGATLIGLLKSNGLDLNRAMIDISSKGSAGWKEILPGQMDFKFNAESFYSEDATVNWATLAAKLIAGTAVAVKMSSGVTGDKYVSGSCYISSLPVKADNQAAETYTITLEGTGALSISTV